MDAPLPLTAAGGPPDERSSAPQSPWSLDGAQVVEALAADATLGLAPEQVAQRRERFGPNRLLQAPRTRTRAILWSQLSSPLIGLLVLAGVAAALWQEWLEAGAILIVIAVNTGLGFYTELRAVRSMEALLRLGRVRTRVRRGGTDAMVDAEALVPGDLVVLDAGDVVTADMRLLEGSHVQVDESMLTGESLPVGKTPAPVRADASLAERTAMLYKGTSVLRGSALAVVVSVGMSTELGAISALVRAVRSDRTPLEEQLAGLGRRLLGATVLIALGITVIGILGGRELLLMVETGVALAIATIPEGLPVVATLAMARGIHRMAAQRALLRSLASVETLGSTSVVLTDKTGTLTENRMAVRGLDVGSGRVSVDVDAAPARRFEARSRGEALLAPDEPDLIDALRVAVLCNSAQLGRGADPHTGDPMEVALLLAGRACGLEREDLLQEEPEWARVAFDPETQRMATRHRGARGARIAMKGAPEAVLAVCARERVGQRERALDDARRAWWLDRNAAWAADGYRVLGLAAGNDDGSTDAPHRDRVWLGLVALLDPPRVGVDHALATCAAAGITVVMVTGDQGGTARTVAESVGIGAGDAEVVTGAQLDQETVPSPALLSARVFARVTPRHKLELVRLHQGAGSIVAMTGDGVNDAPALRQADIGIAMGTRGTEVAKEAADMILEDDSFATIVTAVQLGRVIFDNIRAFVVYLLSCNVSEVMVVAVGSVLGTPLPVLPLQLLFLNFVTDVFPALALGVGEGSADVMERPPRPRAEPIVQPRAWAFIVGYGTLITGAVLGALLVALRLLELGEDGATTVSFLTLALAQLWHVFTMRAKGSPLFVNEITRNRWVWGALLLCLALLLAAVYVPVLALPLGLVPPGRSGWALAVGASLIPWSVGLALGLLRRTGSAQSGGWNDS